MACDARDEAGCRAVVDAALDFGRGKIDGLVNNARMTGRGDFSCASLDGWDEIMTVNARSAFMFTRVTLARLCAARGSVVMMSSVAGLMGEQGLAIYSAWLIALALFAGAVDQRGIAAVSGLVFRQGDRDAGRRRIGSREICRVRLGAGDVR
ncbi:MULTISPECIES: SDR family oxidoreductase [Mesorhizobium]|uniref:SDR family oxidoreductase n=1 Tax=Mesorhizobium TaxID=68287 RepID=UPI0033381821